MNSLFTPENIRFLMQETLRLSEIRQDRPLEEWTTSSWNTLAEHIRTYFETPDLRPYRLSNTTGESLAALYKDGYSERKLAIGSVAVYYLLLTGQFTPTDAELFGTYATRKGKWPLSELHHRRTYIERAITAVLKSQPTDVIEKPTPPPLPDNPIRSNPLWFIVALIGIGVLGLSAFFWSRRPHDLSHVVFKTIGASNDMVAPTTVRFFYDVGNMPFDSLFVIYDDGYKRPLTKTSDTLEFLYTAGLPKTAILQIDTAFVEQELYIGSKHWHARLNNEILPPGVIDQSGYVHLSPTSVPIKSLKNGEYYTYFQLYQRIPVSADEMTYETRVKNPLKEGGISCFDTSISFDGKYEAGKKGKFLAINLLSPNCTNWGLLTIADSRWSHENFDMSPSGVDVSDWITVRITTHQNRAKIEANGKTLYDVPYVGKIGNLVFQQIGFKGSGSIDYVSVRNEEGREIYREDFN